MISQTKLIEQIHAYLVYDMQEGQRPPKNHSEKTDREEVIEFFKSTGGICNGLAVLWAYGIKLEDSNKQKAADSIDGISYLRSTIELLNSWNRVKDLSAEQKRDIDRLVSNIILYQQELEDLFQDGGNQPDFLKTRLQDTKSRSIEQNVKLNLVLGKNMLLARLEKLVKPETMIFVDTQLKGSAGHIVSIFKDSTGKVHLYDPNIGEFSFDSVNIALVEQLWKSTSLLNSLKATIYAYLDNNALRHLYFDIFRFKDESQPEYNITSIMKTSKEEFLTFLIDNPYILALPTTTFRERDNLVTKMFKSLNENGISELLNDITVSPEIKKLLLQFCEIYNWLSPTACAEVSSETSQGTITENKPTAIELDAVFKILRGDNFYLIADCFSNAEKMVRIQNITEDEWLEMVISHVDENHIDIAKLILSRLADINIYLSMQSIINIRHRSLFLLLIDKFPAKYFNKDTLFPILKDLDANSQMCDVIIKELVKLKNSLSAVEKISILSNLSKNICSVDLNYVLALMPDSVVDSAYASNYKKIINSVAKQSKNNLDIVIEILTKAIKVNKISYTREELEDLGITGPHTLVDELLHTSPKLTPNWMAFAAREKASLSEQSECLDLRFKRYGLIETGLKKLESELRKLLEAPNIKTVDLSLNDIGTLPFKGDGYNLFECFSTYLASVSNLVLQASNFRYRTSDEISELFSSLPTSINKLNVSVCDLGANGERSIVELIKIFSSIPPSVRAINLHYNSLGYIAETNGIEEWQKVLNALPKGAIINWGTSDTNYLNENGTLKTQSRLQYKPKM